MKLHLYVAQCYDKNNSAFSACPSMLEPQAFLFKKHRDKYLNQMHGGYHWIDTFEGDFIVIMKFLFFIIFSKKPLHFE